MKMKLHSFFIVLTLLAGVHQVAAQGTTAFTYQGQLHDNGTNANGAYTMIFKLYDAVTSGNQIGSAITNSPTLGNGLFSVNLDFGNVFTGSARWLDITITNGGVTQTLSPRVQVLPTPYAQFAAVAATVTNGAIAAAQIGNGAVTNRNLTANAVNATNIAAGQVVKSLNGLSDAVVLAAGANIALTTNANTLQISATGGGTVTNINIGITNKIAPGANVGLFTNNNIVQISSFTPNFQVYFQVTNAVFTVPTNVSRITVEAWGAGGGGGNSYNDGINTHSGGGGGAGAYAWNAFSVTPGATFLVNPGTAGGTNQPGGFSSFGNLISAGGGTAGGNATISAPGAGGVGGNPTNSIVPVQGGNGSNGDNGGYTSGGDGGGVWRGGAGGQHGGGPGAGGAGGSPGGQGQNGSLGVVIVYY